MKTLLSAILMLTLMVSTPSFGFEFMPEISPEARKVAATAVVQTPNTVAVYARGLCCASCAIGIRKKLANIDVIDRSRFNQGIDLDPKIHPYFLRCRTLVAPNTDDTINVEIIDV